MWTRIYIIVIKWKFTDFKKNEDNFKTRILKPGSVDANHRNGNSPI